MHIGKSYGLVEFPLWTRRKAYVLCAVATLPANLFQAACWRWIAIPWPVLALLGTAASFIVGFKNAQTYSRTLEAQQIWSAITSGSRYWSLISRHFPGSADITKELIYRHMAWLTALPRFRRSGTISSSEWCISWDTVVRWTHADAPKSCVGWAFSIPTSTRRSSRSSHLRDSCGSVTWKVLVLAQFPRGVGINYGKFVIYAALLHT